MVSQQTHTLILSIAFLNADDSTYTDQLALEQLGIRVVHNTIPETHKVELREYLGKDVRQIVLGINPNW